MRRNAVVLFAYLAELQGFILDKVWNLNPVAKDRTLHKQIDLFC